ncbi:MAG: hypothetical protein M3Y80_02430 [Verrucomicrobiota bacterium]|nr:hypothetical protein [Verrucomicrobiota bacterium]
MNNFDENDIATLLRLKRHEQPPPAYFDNFLHEFHRRQRAELLKQPLWRIALQRAQDFMMQVNVPSLSSYPVAAAAVVVCAAVLSLNVARTPSDSHVASVAMEKQQSAAVARATGDSAWNLATPVSTAHDFDSAVFRTATQAAPTRRTGAPPRYVLDTVPVSYEASLRF